MAIQTSHVDPILIRLRAPLVVCVDTATCAKVVLGFLGIEAVERQDILAFEDRYVLKFGRDRDGATHPAIRTGAAARRVETIGEPRDESNGAAMAPSFEPV
jgi:hypothetical protein